MESDIRTSVFFQPTFGNRPECIVGRDGEITSFLQGLKEPIGSHNRCTLFFGQRGMGKTALLLELEDQAEDNGYIAVRTTVREGLADEIIEQIQFKGAHLFKDDKRRLTGINAGVLGFSFGLTFSDETRKQFGFRTKLSMLCDRLAEKKKGILLLIDEVHSSPEMREIATSYQELVGDGKNIAIAMAGLPYAISSVLNDKVLTFLNRAKKVELGLISIPAIKAYYEYAFSELGIRYDDKVLEDAASATQGMPYLMQLIGYYLVQLSRSTRAISAAILEKARIAAISDLESNVFAPILNPLSKNDRFFLQAMAEEGEVIEVSSLQKRLGNKASSFQPYRRRLIDAGIVESPRNGRLVFAVPHLAEYLRNNPIQL